MASNQDTVAAEIPVSVDAKPSFLDTGFEWADDPPPAPLGFLAPPAGPDEIGRLAHYRVLKVLGQGGMGIVLLAEDTQLQRPVACYLTQPRAAPRRVG